EQALERRHVATEASIVLGNPNQKVAQAAGLPVPNLLVLGLAQAEPPPTFAMPGRHGSWSLDSANSMTSRAHLAGSFHASEPEKRMTKIPSANIARSRRLS